ncbi:AMIN-like domain-containing (lipo)protein [Dactylosporangium sp. CA-092794]|uniref:AMIN-like domain-containing (lipo)protein n=1 Tax=Dactylosporangium sp. CA-092794 TaxID=3239929 RepID=UPI003D8F0CEC
MYRLLLAAAARAGQALGAPGPARTTAVHRSAPATAASGGRALGTLDTARTTAVRRSLLYATVCGGLVLGLSGVALAADQPGVAAQAADLPAPTGTAPVTGEASGAGRPVLTGIRTGRHDAYDRTVFDFTGGTPGYRVEYGPLVEQGRGDTVPVAGQATLVVVFTGLDNPALDLSRVYDPALPTLRQIRSGGYFEGHANFGLGLNDRVGFRVLVLHGPDRIAVDVAHQPDQAFQSGAYQHTGTAPDALVTAVRSGRHPGYDRLVFDMAGDQAPSLDVRYPDGGPHLRVTFTGAGSPTTAPHASHSGPGEYTFGLPTLRGLRFTVVGAGIMTADVTTAARHGFRVMLLPNPNRVVVDIAT